MSTTPNRKSLTPVPEKAKTVANVILSMDDYLPPADDIRHPCSEGEMDQLDFLKKFANLVPDESVNKALQSGNAQHALEKSFQTFPKCSPGIEDSHALDCFHFDTFAAYETAKDVQTGRVMDDELRIFKELDINYNYNYFGFH